MGEKLWKKSSVLEWHKLFKEGRENVDDDDDERSRRPVSHRTDENVENVRSVVHSGRRFSI
jgi:hypothetical protein